MNVSTKLLCPSCRGSRMVLGQAKTAGALDTGDSQFHPSGNWTFLGFQRYEVACLDCGYVGTCLSEDERAGLEKKVREG